MQDKRVAPPPFLYLMLHYTNSKQPICLPTKWDKGAFGKNYDNYENYLLSTDRLEADQYQSLSHISVSTDQDCRNESDTIAIQTIVPKPYQYNFGVCLHKGIGSDLKPQLLLDYVKMHVAVGAELITIYLQTGAEGVYDILMPYINKGIVEILDWKLEPEFTNGGSHHYGQTGVLCECLWRNIYRVKYLGMNDVDEFFIPVKHNSIQELMTEVEKLEKKTPAATLGFPNFLMKGNTKLPLVEKALKSKQCPQLERDSLPVYYKRSRGCVVRGRSSAQKVIFRPEAIYLPWVHCQIIFKRSKYIEEYKIPEDLGLSYHYRPHWNHYKKCSTPEYEARVVEKFLKNITNCNFD